jgi:hypothetical protein
MHATVRIRRYGPKVKDIGGGKGSLSDPGFQHRGHRKKRRKEEKNDNRV